MKKKSFIKKYPSTAKMDQDLVQSDLSEIFEKQGQYQGPSLKKINLDLPVDMVAEIDELAKSIGVARQPLLKVWIHERLKQEL